MKPFIQFIVTLTYTLLAAASPVFAENGDEFIGFWKALKTKETFNITRDGTRFNLVAGLIALNATCENGDLKIETAAGSRTATLNKQTGTLTYVDEYRKAGPPLRLNVAQEIKNELFTLSRALDQYAMEYNTKDGTTVPPGLLLPYIEESTRLATALKDPSGPKDIYGNPFGPLVVGKPVKASVITVTDFAGIVDEDFWP